MQILRINDVKKATGLSRTTIWRLERSNQFPHRVRLSENAVGWVRSEVEDWLLSQPRGMSRGIA